MNDKLQKMILTAGPHIAKNDVRYVTDAAVNGWNFHHSDYIYAFEEAFAKYLGVRYALTMPTGTAAMHVALELFGVGPGDEVIIPDLTYIACANAVSYTGAKPVLVDVDWETWSIDVNTVKRYITSRTKAIMPVHLYGNVADIDGIHRLARKHNLFVLEDACEGLGCTLRGKKIGTFGDAAAFSFQGAKLLAIGEGGMFVTNRKDWIEKARSLVDHGVSFKHQFWHNYKGFMYPMSNIQAALGLSRLEDIDWSVERKRTIFEWYKKILADVEGLMLNPQRSNVLSSYWMSSIVLKKQFAVHRNKLRKELKARMIDTRPFFYPISAFGLYGPKHPAHPVSYAISAGGVNLPSGVMLDEQTVDYVATTVRSLLGA